MKLAMEQMTPQIWCMLLYTMRIRGRQLTCKEAQKGERKGIIKQVAQCVDQKMDCKLYGIICSGMFQILVECVCVTCKSMYIVACEPFCVCFVHVCMCLCV